MITIKPYSHSDFEQICSWWDGYGESRPVEGMMIENGTFILELNEIPTLCLTVLLTQSKEMAYLFAFIKNPTFNGQNLEEYGRVLWDYCAKFAKDLGYKRVICFAGTNKLKDKYEKFGMKQTMTGLSSLVKELS